MSSRDDLAIKFREFLRRFPPFSPIIVLVACMLGHSETSSQSFRSSLSSGTLFIGCMLLASAVMRRRIHRSRWEFYVALFIFFGAGYLQYRMMRWSILSPPEVESFYSLSTWPIWISIWVYVFLYLWSLHLGALDTERMSFGEHD